MPTARTVSELLEYYGRSVVALRVLDGAVEALGEVERKRFPRRREGVVEVLEGMRDELDDEVVLAIIASAERELRLDFRARLGGKGAVRGSLRSAGRALPWARSASRRSSTCGRPS
jgi:hypothetical protein